MKKWDHNVKYALSVIVIILSIYVIYKYILTDNVSPFESKYDGRKYNVRIVGDAGVKQNAADYLAVVSNNIDKIVNYMYINKLPDPDTSIRLFNRWRKCELKETSSGDKSAAYTLNKSKEIRLCIRKSDSSFEDINTSMFVILHELAHVMSVGFGHGDEFKQNFSYITHLASNLGIYKPQDFSKNPVNYCGVEINTTPCENNSCEYNVVNK
jgi:hypothetical protein